MTITINPPAFNKTKSYERYKQELLAWKEVTDLSSRKQAIAVALSLPEEDETQIRDKVFDQLPLEELKKENGLSLLVTFFDKHLAKDDLSDSLEKFTDFENYERSEGQTIHDFIENFDTKYRRIEKKSMQLPSEILAFKLLQKARINHKEKLLVLTGMNYGNRKTLYEEAKMSLKKFKGDHLSSEKQVSKINVRKFVKNEEVLVAGCAFKAHRKLVQKTKASCNQGGIGGCSDSVKLSPKAFNRRQNQFDANGKILRCHACDSFRHLLASCPDSWENMERVKGSKEENLPKGYSWDGMTNIRVDTNNSAVSDNGHSSTECRSKRGCKASTDEDTKYEKEKSSQEFAKKYDERVKPKFQVQDAFNSRFQVKEEVIAKMPYKGRLKNRRAPEVETERGFEWKEADRNWKWHIEEKQVSRNEKERMVVLATNSSPSIYAKQKRKETPKIQCKANNDITADYMIRSSWCKAMGENNKRHLYKTQHQLKQEWIRQQAKNNERNREKEESSTKDHRIQEGRRWKEAAGLIRGQPKRWRMDNRRGKLRGNQEL